MKVSETDSSRTIIDEIIVDLSLREENIIAHMSDKTNYGFLICARSSLGPAPPPGRQSGGVRTSSIKSSLF
jgi:hypothetical protein